MAKNSGLRIVSYGTARLQKRVLVKSCLLGIDVAGFAGSSCKFVRLISLSLNSTSFGICSL